MFVFSCSLIAQQIHCSGRCRLSLVYARCKQRHADVDQFAKTQHHLACSDETYSQSAQQRLHRLTRAAATSPCMRASFSGALRRRCSNDDGGIKRLRSTCSRRHDHVITVNDVGEHASWLRLDKDIAAMVSAWCEAACVRR